MKHGIQQAGRWMSEERRAVALKRVAEVLGWLTAAALFAFASHAVLAQQQSDDEFIIEERRMEIGGLFTAVNLEGFEETSKGVGARFAYNINRNFAVDAEASVMPSGRFGNRAFGDRAQGFVGLKAGARNSRVGLFAKARPGVMFIGEVTSGFDCDRTGFGQVCRPQHSQFALDLGGVLEFYPTPGTIIRFDAGDTLVRLRTASGFFGGRQSSTDLTHNFQASIGFGYRF
ncbi:MAG TPA: hypothetical protein VD968_07935 [Pyrinomonadaceae bacterium]|nr:hypothetical protein [Pyrinomonadaceae bacterium]